MTKQDNARPTTPLPPPPDDAAGVDRHVMPRQSNHERYALPMILGHLPPMPLYLSVAHFGLLTGKPVSREEICQAFHLDTRRALEIMRYLVNSAPQVTCKCLPLIQGQGHRLRILAITTPEGADDTPVATPVTARLRGSAAERERAHQPMRQWFLRRPNPSGPGLDEQGAGQEEGERE
ncbi:CaiF/GrlA family transcriptional regulator [Serratia marcescens]|uniref:CaiF/GrlA family transcriptional regulator n=1 Tax=Serratia marcescens TaxID=615 RepID=UPI00217768C3|nr:CaiF/GrlA family transcriptional regulator [Serratia marcescens]CAI1188642.1 Protein of uncharacterised function (DUF1401) [Serratia marcescens]